jgi:hypothetical protein
MHKNVAKYRFRSGYLSLLSVSTAAAGAGRDGHGYASIGIGMPDFNFEMDRKATAEDTSESVVTFSPNLPLTAVAKFSIHGLTLGATFDIPGTKDTSNETASAAKVKTTYTNYAASYFFDHLGASASYTKLKGMNVTAMSGATGESISADTESHRSDIKLVDQSASLWIAPLGLNFSLRDFLDPASKSRGSGLGLVVVGAYDLLSVNAHGALIPSGHRQFFGSDQSFEGGQFKSLAAEVGPAITIDFFGLYLSGMYTFGSGSQNATYHNEGGADQSTSRNSERDSLHLATGFKGDTVFSCLEFSQESPGYALGSATIATIRSELTWIFGVRF